MSGSDPRTGPFTGDVTSARIMALRQTGSTRTFTGHTGLPADSARAYALSAGQITDDVLVGAWKLGGATATTQAAFATRDVYFGAVLGAEIWQQGDAPARIALHPFRGEAEIALRVAQDIPADLARAGVGAEVFDAFAPCIESPWSVVADLPQAGLPALLMDRCAAGALFLAAPQPVEEAAMSGPIAIVQDGATVAEGGTDMLLATPLAVACDAVARIGAAGHGLRAGQWIATGGLTPCVPLRHDSPFTLVFRGTAHFTTTLATDGAPQ